MYVIKYATATDVTTDRNSLAGSFMYFADPKDAFDTGLICKKIVSYSQCKTDFLDKPFQLATEKEVIDHQQNHMYSFNI